MKQHNNNNDYDTDTDPHGTLVVQPVVANPEPREKKNNKTILLVVAGAAGLFLLTRLSGPKVPPLTKAQEDLLLEAGSGDIEDVSTKPIDKSAPIYLSKDGSLTVEELDSLIDRHYAKYETKCAAIAGKLQTASENVFGTVAILFSTLPPGQVVTEAALTGYFKVLEVWASRFDFALKTVSEAVNGILINQIAGINSGQKCSQWAYIKSTDITQTNSSLKSAVVTNTGKTSSGFLGIVGKKKSSSSQTVSSSTVTSQLQEKVTFVPHCVSYQLDPSVVLSVLNSSSVALGIQYDLLNTVLALAPKPENFITNTKSIV